MSIDIGLTEYDTLPACETLREMPRRLSSQGSPRRNGHISIVCSRSIQSLPFASLASESGTRTIKPDFQSSSTGVNVELPISPPYSPVLLTLRNYRCGELFDIIAKVRKWVTSLSSANQSFRREWSSSKSMRLCHKWSWAVHGTWGMTRVWEGWGKYCRFKHAADAYALLAIGRGKRSGNGSVLYCCEERNTSCFLMAIMH